MRTVYTFSFIWSSSINMMGKWAILLHSFPLFSSQWCSFNKGDYSSILSEAAHPLWITCTWAQSRKWLWHHSSANPLLSEKIFRYIYQKINIQININVIELKWVEYKYNIITHYLTIKQRRGSHCDFSSCNDFIIHMYARMWAILHQSFYFFGIISFMKVEGHTSTETTK